MTILDKAAAAVADRRTRYGEPQVNHTCTARLFRAWIIRRYGIDVPFTARDVCWLNILQKASRDADTPGEDNLVDTAGFAENASRCLEGEPACGVPSVTDVSSRSGDTSPAPSATELSKLAAKDAPEISPHRQPCSCRKCQGLDG